MNAPSPADATPFATAFVTELRQEATTTRRVLQRVPPDALGWRPHPRSMSLGQLAMHVAQLPLGIGRLLDDLRTELPDVPLAQPETVDEILAALDQGVEDAAARLARWGDDGLAAVWTLVHDGQPLIAQPRSAMVRTLMLNHAYHHRGQLLVYLRLLDVPVPAVYGPTADENPLG